MILKSGREWLVVILLVLLIADLVILLDIPLLRQTIGFLFLTFLPGLLILQVLKLDKIEFTEKVVLLVGLSISFLMLFGLLINTLLLSLGYETPLSTISLLIAFNLVFIILAIMGYKINKDGVFSLPNINLTTSEKVFLIVPIFFPALSIFGMYLMNTTDNNIILMFLYLLIPLYVIFVCFYNNKFPKRLYPVVIFSISVSLLLLYMLRFPHIHGRDIHSEYCLFRITLNNLHWGIMGPAILNACLSISLLPAIYQSLMNVNAQEYLFKGVCLVICSFTPLTIYIIAKKYIAESYAFLASFFFISQSAFLTGGARTQIAIFFVALALMVFFNEKIDSVKRSLIFIIFILSVVVSHYSTAYLFFFMLLSAWFILNIFATKHTFNKKITLTSTLIFFAFIFFWYSQIAITPFNAGLGYFRTTFSKLNDFFIEESRYEGFEQLAGHGLQHGLISEMNFLVIWGSFILIGLGVLTLLISYKEMLYILSVEVKKPDFLKSKFEVEFLAIALASAGIVIATIVLPYVATGYGIDRMYSLVMITLSVCFVIGGIIVSKILSFIKKKLLLKKQKIGINTLQNPVRKSIAGEKDSQVLTYVIILIILIPYFLMSTFVSHQIAGIPISIILNSEGEKYEWEYLHDQECSSANWLKNCAEKNIKIYATDRFGMRKLVSQAEKIEGTTDYGSFSRHAKIRGFLYLTYNNVVNDRFGGATNRSDHADMFVGNDRIYDNGGSEVYK